MYRPIGKKRSKRDEHGYPGAGPSFGMAPAGTCTCTSIWSNVDAGILRSSARDFTSVSAACALSFITPPSCPVRISWPRPLTRVASMKRMSPPTGVHARPVPRPADSRAARSHARISPGREWHPDQRHRHAPGPAHSRRCAWRRDALPARSRVPTGVPRLPACSLR